MLDPLMNSSPADAWAGPEPSRVFFSNQAIRTTPDGSGMETNQPQEPATQGAVFSFAELLAGGAVEVEGAGSPVRLSCTPNANEPIRKNQKRVDGLEAQAQAQAGAVPVLAVLDGSIPPIQFGTGQGDVPTWNANVESMWSMRDPEPGGGHLVALTYDLPGEASEPQGSLVDEPDLSGPAATEPGRDDSRGAKLSVPAVEPSDSGTSDRPLSNPLALNHPLELPAAMPMARQSDSHNPLGLPEPVPAKNSAADALTPRAQETVAAGGRVPQNRLPQTDSGPARPSNRIAEAAAATVRAEPAHTVQAKASTLTVTGEPSGDAVFSLLVARGDTNTDSEITDAGEAVASAASRSSEPAEGQGLPDRPTVELPRSSQTGSEPDSGDQHGSQLLGQHGESGGLGTSTSPNPAFSFFSDVAPAEPQAEQVWSRLDGGAIQPDPHPAAPAQPLTSIDLTSSGLDRVSIRVLESRGGLEVQVATQDTVAKQDLLGGLDELAGRVRELSLGTVIPGRNGPDTGQDFQRGNRQPQSPDRENWRPRAKKSSFSFALPAGSLGEQVASQPVRRS